MILLELFLGFLQVGCFAFGGAYGAIPLIRDVVLSYGWLTEESLTYMIAVSESTPGPIMVNVATYVGSSQGGFFGAVVATLAVVLPSFVVILLVLGLLKTAMKNKYVQAVLQGVKPCVMGIVLATGLGMVLGNCFAAETGLQLSAVLITALLAGAFPAWKAATGKKISPIMLIVISAVLGIVVYGL